MYNIDILGTLNYTASLSYYKAWQKAQSPDDGAYNSVMAGGMEQQSTGRSIWS